MDDLVVMGGDLSLQGKAVSAQRSDSIIIVDGVGASKLNVLQEDVEFGDDSNIQLNTLEPKWLRQS